MVEVKNLLFQPITLHYGAAGRGFHLGPRERIQLRDEDVSPEMEMAARRKHIALTTLPGEPVVEGPLSPVTDPEIEEAVKQNFLAGRQAMSAARTARRRN